jgi:hypothetical protein
MLLYCHCTTPALKIKLANRRVAFKGPANAACVSSGSGRTFSRGVEDAMNTTAVKPKEQLCQAISRVDEPCDRGAQQYCERCGQWYCRAHFPDPDWHTCAPEQGVG